MAALLECSNRALHKIHGYGDGPPYFVCPGVSCVACRKPDLVGAQHDEDCEAARKPRPTLASNINISAKVADV